MPSATLGVVNRSDNSITTAPINITPPGARSYVLLAIGIASGTTTVSSVTGGSGTWTKIAGKVVGSQSIELWLGYNFPSTSVQGSTVTVTVTYSAGSTVAVIIARTIAVDSNTASAPTVTASAGGSGTGTTPDPAAITPAVGDLLWAVIMTAATGTPTARTSTGNDYLPADSNSSQTATGMRLEIGYGDALAAASSDFTITTTSALWVAIQVKITPVAQSSPSAALVTKGLDTAALDAASSY